MLVVDTETGGLDPARHALVSIGAIHMESGAEFSMLIRPADGLELEDQAVKVHGLSAEHLEQHGVDEEVAMVAFASWLRVFGPQDWMGANPDFDRGFIAAAFRRHRIMGDVPRRPVDVQAVAWLAWLAWRLGALALPCGRNGLVKRSLDALLEAVGLSRGESGVHDALEDARLTLAVWDKLERLIREIGGRK
jgi:DNA polymerase III epsilon subunit-like protein